MDASVRLGRLVDLAAAGARFRRGFAWRYATPSARQNLLEIACPRVLEILSARLRFAHGLMNVLSSTPKRFVVDACLPETAS